MAASGTGDRRIAELSGLFDTCESLAELHAAMYRALSDAVGCDSGVCFDATQTPLGWRFVRGRTIGVSDADLMRWTRDLQTRDPFVLHLCRLFRLGRGKVLTSADIIARTNYEASTFYNDFLKPQSIFHVMTIGTARVGLPPGVPGGMIGLHRSRRSPPFSESEIARAKTLLPRYETAHGRVQMMEMTREREAIVEALSQEPPLRAMMILDHHCAPTFADRECCALLGLQPTATCELPETASREIIRCFEPLRQRLAAGPAGSGGQRAIWQFSGTAPSGLPIDCRVHLCDANTLSPYFILCFPQAEAHPAAAPGTGAFGLSPREAEVAYLVIRGLSNPQIAHALRISVRTVQNHLRAIYQKVEVGNRTGLAVALLQGGERPQSAPRAAV